MYSKVAFVGNQLVFDNGAFDIYVPFCGMGGGVEARRCWGLAGLVRECVCARRRLTNKTNKGIIMRRLGLAPTKPTTSVSLATPPTAQPLTCKLRKTKKRIGKCLLPLAPCRPNGKEHFQYNQRRWSVHALAMYAHTSLAKSNARRPTLFFIHTHSPPTSNVCHLATPRRCQVTRRNV